MPLPTTQTSAERRAANAAAYGLQPVDTAWDNCPIWLVAKDANEAPMLAEWDAYETEQEGEDAWLSVSGRGFMLWSDVLGWTEDEAVARAAHDYLWAGLNGSPALAAQEAA